MWNTFQTIVKMRFFRRVLLLTCLCLASLTLFGLSSNIALERSFVSAPFSFSLQTWQRALYTFKGPPKVGVQVGHLNPHEQPEELAKLRFNTGGATASISELEINLAVAQHLKTTLEAYDVKVDILPARIPPGYKADLVLSLHADASPDPTRNGYKSSHFIKPRNKHEPLLKESIDRAYFYYSGLADDDQNVSGSMLEYYAFNHKRYKHSIAASTPALIVEMGYISNSQDLNFLEDPINPAYALLQGVLSYLKERNRLSPK